MTRPIAAFLLVCALLSPASAQTPSPSAPGWTAEVQRLLDARARALRVGDEAAFVATMQGAPRSFVDAKVAALRRLRTLPVDVYSLKLFDGGFGDLADDADRRRYGPDVHVVQVKERIGFRGYDRRTAVEDLYLTVRKDASAWRVVSDSDRESLFLLSMRNVWDFGPVESFQRDGVMVIVHPAQHDAAARILTAAIRARDTARARWPYPWSDPIIIMVPSTVDELSRILQTQFDLSTFVAFASASEDRTFGWALTGFRVFLHWPNFSKQPASFQQVILDHEFTHLASFNTNSPFMPSFMDEGVAQFYGEAAGRGTRSQERKSIRNGTFSGRLPEDWEFSAGSDDQIYRSYEQAQSFQAYLADRFGHDAGARVFIAVAKQNPVAPGTDRYHLEKAFRDTLKVSFGELERLWAAREEADLR